MDAVADISEKTVIRKLNMLVIELPEVYRCINNTDNGKTYFIFKKYVKYCKSKRLLAKIKRAEKGIIEEDKKINAILNTKADYDIIHNSHRFIIWWC